MPLLTAKLDIKKRCSRRDMSKRWLGSAEGPVLLLGVHLCGTLSLQAIHLFNENPRVGLLVLKPCCLPGIEHIRRELS